MSRQLLRGTSLQRAANVVAATSSRPMVIQPAHPMEHRSPLQQQQCKLTPSIVIRRWKSFLHNNNSSAQTAAATTAEAATVTVTATPRRSQAETLNARGSHSPFDAPSRCMSTKSQNNMKFVTIDNINANFKAMEYAVRGPIVIRAGEIEKELLKGVKKPFDRVIRANIGDCHAMGQKPLTYLRQLMALTMEPRLLNSPEYPEDMKKRARDLLDACLGGSTGSYTDSAGIEFVRRQVAAFIEKRDGGVPCDYQNIYLTGGASPGIKSVLSLLNCTVDGKTPGVMVPIPQYPLYSASLTEMGMTRVDYFLDEDNCWGLDRKELQRSYNEAKKQCNPRVLVVINPGNPTGQVLTRKNIEEIIKFAYDNKMIIMADEVYQANVYDKNSKFYSFKMVMNEMGGPHRTQELISFLSVSKGYLGECGIRGGYMEVINMCPDVKAVLTKSITAQLCSTTAGQIAVSALVNPPQPGEPSYELYEKEKSAVLGALKERAKLVYDTLSTFEGYTVNPVQGAMYVFPKIEIPAKAVEAAKAKKMHPDVFYAFELLETTGICIVPGSGFGQIPGTYHFRSTILPQTDLLKEMMKKFGVFHTEFMKKYQ
ncbi:alanine aminotransferase 2 [Drosophila grimshawi]|uniref:alanine transaminase n=1 Tax=Drosophila grimshawi TaxID=7222 RepID=B4JLP7_DROGR|nr:alanine aminotransferase 2 [Drosophila grimshawi]XP_032594462.1 alanine aminotransferase 2 [Drosophila grimshawi]XP_032594463.1 alanine aminotransferase 2 [Drosophila grimshawi]XP_032594464.1 alanine aminotransferase 2 [Drosophila grimshawi]XP_032594465.1 alanine aminotransferase 2 [Drosophila grimshawi]EDV91658.1 GH24493 [Drosophila grimshawi]